MVAFVLSGGASHGAVQVGMLRALSEAGIEPDALYGTSVGAVNASVYSHLPAADRLDALDTAWREFGNRPPIRPSLARNALAVARRRQALSDLSPLRAQLEHTLGCDTRIEDGSVPLVVTATSLLDGRERAFQRGQLVETLMASCAVPGLFPPVKIEGVPYVDGLLYGAPVTAAIEDGYDTLYLLLTNSSLDVEEIPTSWFGIARRAATMVMWNHVTTPAGDRSDRPVIHTVPAPASMAAVNRWDFARTEDLLAESQETASRWLSAKLGEELVP